MTAGPPSLCVGCRGIEEECIWWEEKQAAWDALLLSAFTRHEPPLHLSALCARTELCETGCLVEVIKRGWVSLWVFFDDEWGDVYLVPPYIEWAREMEELVRDDDPVFVLLPELPTESAPQPRCPAR